MDTENNKWLDALSGNSGSPSDESEIQMAHKVGIHLRKSFESGEFDEEGLNKLIQRLENENLLERKSKFTIAHYWQYAVAAVFVMAVSIPVVLLQNPTTDYDYPKVRGLVDTLKISSTEPELTLHKIKNKLSKMGYKSQVYQRDNNLILVFTLNELTPDLVKMFDEYSVNLNNKGNQYIEFTKENKE